MSSGSQMNGKQFLENITYDTKAIGNENDKNHGSFFFDWELNGRLDRKQWNIKNFSIVTMMFIIWRSSIATHTFYIDYFIIFVSFVYWE